MSSSVSFSAPLLCFRSREHLSLGLLRLAASSQAGMESRCRRSMGDMERRGNALWAWLADFLSRALKGIACILSVCLPVSLSVSFPITQWSAMEEERKRETAASEETGKNKLLRGKSNLRKKYEREWLPVHRLRECRRRSSGHDGAMTEQNTATAWDRGAVNTARAGQTVGQKERADGTVSRAREGWTDRQRDTVGGWSDKQKWERLRCSQMCLGRKDSWEMDRRCHYQSAYFILTNGALHFAVFEVQNLELML